METHDSSKLKFLKREQILNSLVFFVLFFCFLLAVVVEVTKPTVTIPSPVLTVQQGQRAELRCTVTGNPPPSIEWTGEVWEKPRVNQ